MPQAFGAEPDGGRQIDLGIEVPITQTINWNLHWLE